MTGIQPLTLPNLTVLIPVNPAIKNHLRGLLNKTDYPVLTAMET